MRVKQSGGRTGRLSTSLAPMGANLVPKVSSQIRASGRTIRREGPRAEQRPLFESPQIWCCVWEANPRLASSYDRAKNAARSNN